MAQVYYILLSVYFLISICYVRGFCFVFDISTCFVLRETCSILPSFIFRGGLEEGRPHQSEIENSGTLNLLGDR